MPVWCRDNINRVRPTVATTSPHAARSSYGLRVVECAWCSLRYNAWARQVWLRLVNKGIDKKEAIVALARTLLIRCWGILKSGRPWAVTANSRVNSEMFQHPNGHKENNTVPGPAAAP